MRNLIGWFCLVALGASPACEYANSNGARHPAPNPEILELGEKVYRAHCRACHLPGGKSRIKRLNLADEEWTHLESTEDLEKVISNGVDATQMQSFRDLLTPEEIAAVAEYVRSFSQSK